ncbi:MAG: 4-hydroxy-tetrahydrodipicolinate reductase [Clostridia bacterium]|nr:4-hydroxy-tetrahydrodipicolinate reductase [Clostridia bacterium]
MTKLLIVGYGRMGKMIEDVAGERNDCRVIGKIDTFLPAWDEKEVPDAILDFSAPEGVEKSIEMALKYNCALVIGTTGFDESAKKRISEAAQRVPVIVSSNYSLGIAVLKKAVALTAKALGEDFDIEIIEAHHNKKQDAPSGTALTLAEVADVNSDKPRLYGRQGKVGARGREIGLHAVRGGTQAGEHRVLFMGDNEIIELRHEAQSRRIFASGAVKAALALAGRPAGLYTMDDIIEI